MRGGVRNLHVFVARRPNSHAMIKTQWETKARQAGLTLRRAPQRGIASLVVDWGPAGPTHGFSRLDAPSLFLQSHRLSRSPVFLFASQNSHLFKIAYLLVRCQDALPVPALRGEEEDALPVLGLWGRGGIACVFCGRKEY